MVSYSLKWGVTCALSGSKLDQGTKVQKGVNLRGWFVIVFIEGSKSQDCNTYGIKTAIKLKLNWLDLSLIGKEMLNEVHYDIFLRLKILKK